MTDLDITEIAQHLISEGFVAEGYTLKLLQEIRELLKDIQRGKPKE